MEHSLEYNKRVPSLSYYFWRYFSAAFNIKKMTRAKRNGVDQKFLERIMLAVTEVNGCKVCAQAHAKMALESGMSEEEISSLLSNEQDMVPQHQGVGIMYATHFADTEGHTDPETDKRLVETYGEKTAEGIVAGIKMISLGNALGIIQGCFQERLKGNPNKDSSLLKELLVFILTVLLIPVFIVVVLLGFIFN